MDIKMLSLGNIFQLCKVRSFYVTRVACFFDSQCTWIYSVFIHVTDKTDRQTDTQTDWETDSWCLMSCSDLSSEILSLTYALNPFTLYNSSFFFSSSADRITAEPCSPGPPHNTASLSQHSSEPERLYTMGQSGFTQWARAALHNGPVHLFVCSSVCCQNAYKKCNFSKTKQSKAMVSIDDP